MEMDDALAFNIHHLYSCVIAVCSPSAWNACGIAFHSWAPLHRQRDVGGNHLVHRQVNQACLDI